MTNKPPTLGTVRFSKRFDGLFSRNNNHKEMAEEALSWGMSWFVDWSGFKNKKNGPWITPRKIHAEIRVPPACGPQSVA